MRRSRVLAPLAFLGLIAGLLALIDRVAMWTRWADERKFLADIDHRPPRGGGEFNEHGIRDRRPPSAFRESDFNVIFLGDSFVFGFLLEPHQAIPPVFERRARRRHPELNVNAANFAWVSASPYLSLRQLREIGAAYHPDLVLLCIDMTDFHDDIKYEKYLEKPGLFGILRVMPSLFFALKDLATPPGMHEALFGYPRDRFFPVNRPLDETRPWFAFLQRNVDAIAEYATATLGARFALLVLPRHIQYDAEESPNNWEAEQYTVLGPWVHEPFRYFEALEGTRPYPIGSLLEDFQRTEVFPTTFRGDPHWNVQGVGVAVEGILRFVEAEGLLAGPPGLPRTPLP